MGFCFESIKCDHFTVFNAISPVAVFNKDGGGSHVCQKIQAALPLSDLSGWRDEIPTATLFIAKFHLENLLSEATYCHASQHRVEHDRALYIIM